MPIVTLFSGTYCRADAVVGDVLSSTGCRLITDRDVAAEAGRHFSTAPEKIVRAFSAKTSVFNRFTHEKETAVAFLKYALVEMLNQDHLLISGFCSQLLPTHISHVLRVCLIADLSFRIAFAVETEGVSEKEANRRVHSHDEDCAAWSQRLHGQSDPWDNALYDLVLPMHKTGVAEAGALIEENLIKDVLKPTEHSRKALADFRLAAEVQVALAQEGHNVGVICRAGHITLTINKQVLLLARLSEELAAIADRVPGVISVDTQVGKDYHRSDIYRKHDFQIPSKVLLVDDERDFVQTLSERLQLREMGSAVAYDGQSALNLVRDDEPEVMIIDLKMPGIDGLEVLKQVKQTRPEIEVIVLTGHGADADRDQCLALGAFGYLQKPVDIDELSEMLRRAHEKIRNSRGKTDPPQ